MLYNRLQLWLIIDSALSQSMELLVTSGKSETFSRCWFNARSEPYRRWVNFNARSGERLVFAVWPPPLERAACHIDMFCDSFIWPCFRNENLSVFKIQK